MSLNLDNDIRKLALFGSAQRRGYPRKRLVGDALFSFCSDQTSILRGDVSG